MNERSLPPGEPNPKDKLQRMRWVFSPNSNRSPDSIYFMVATELRELADQFQRWNSDQPKQNLDQLILQVLPDRDVNESDESALITWLRHLKLAPLRLLQHELPWIGDEHLGADYLTEVVHTALDQEDSSHQACVQEFITDETHAHACQEEEVCAYKVTYDIFIQQMELLAINLQSYELEDPQTDLLHEKLDACRSILAGYNVMGRDELKRRQSELLSTALREYANPQIAGEIGESWS
ncbi:MAG TPA: hypothetical protein VH144_00855 [Candidatus Saccharimonadales bacterium]|jgi:hypothetical protein|nr:hypothetical protein [Candidatus Saccharimonadales bacterium]